MLPAMWDKDVRFTVGDPLRAVAALGVVGVHILSALPVAAAPGVPAGFDVQAVTTKAGFLLSLAFPAGLLLFFVLSGYLIARPFTRAVMEGRELPRSGRYLRNRALRVVPLFWFVITLLLVAEWAFGWVSVFGQGGTTSAGEALALYGFMQNATPHSPLAVSQLGPAWTLHVEAAFYLLVPVAAMGMAGLCSRLAPRARSLAIVAGCTAVAVGSFVLLADRLPADPRDVHWFVFTAYGFMPGVALAALEPLLAPRIGPGARSRAAALGLALAALAAIAAFALLGRGGHVVASQAFGLVGVAGAVAACLVRQWSGAPAWRLLDNRVLHWIGERSYSVYLLHGTVLAAVVALPSGSPRVVLAELTLLTLAGTLGLSALTYRWVEQPFLRRRRHVPAEPAGALVSPGPA
jgi:peptidoglycan/LPS O-acetylase OafA/YrhL